MGAALSERLAEFGPTQDPHAAERTKAVLLEAASTQGWIGTLERAWPVLEPAFSASPYLSGLARRDPTRLGMILGSDPADHLQALLERVPVQGGRGLEGPEERAELRRLKGELHLLTAICDLGGVWDLMEVTGALSDFADRSIAAALRIAAEEEIVRGRLLRAPDLEHGPVPGLFALALGKLGAEELNYSSDIDVSVFYDPDSLLAAPIIEPQTLALRLTQAVVEILQARTSDGYVFRVDLRLRPDPSSTPVAMPVEAALDYYETAGQNWERAAMIKARVAAGDQSRGEAFVLALQPFVWRRNLDYGAISDIHAIKRQIHVYKVDERLTAPGANLKLGAGGIREIEFFVQTQQLIYGGRDRGLRQRATMQALSALAEAGHVAESVNLELKDAYQRLRSLEHRIQMINDEQTHVLPESRPERQRVAVLSGFKDLALFDASVSAILKRVNARYGELFAEDEPLSSRFGSLVFTGVEDDPETLDTLGRMGFSHPSQVSGMIRSWHHGRISATGTERGRELFTRLGPRLLQAAYASGAPDAAFNRFADFFSNLRSGVQVQSLFLAEPKLFRLVLEVMAFAPRLAATLARQPAALDALLDPHFFGAFKDGEAAAALRAALDAVPDFERAMDAARRVHREEAFRIGVRVMSGTLDAEGAGKAFAELADGCIATLAGASIVETERLGGALAGDAAIVALGKAGSREMTASSDLDLMTLYAPKDPQSVSALKGWGAETYYARFTQRLIAALSAPTAAGVPYRVDLQLRPSGTAGPIAVSMSAFESYYDREAETWEYLALTRARVVWATSSDFAIQAQEAVEATLRRPRDLERTAADVQEMRTLMRKERPAFGRWDLKLTDGGLVDIEFAAQFLQIVHGAEGGPLRMNTGAALLALADAKAAPSAEIAHLSFAWSLQQTLSQVLKVALPEGADPATEPPRFQAILSKVAGAKDFKALQQTLWRAQDVAHGAYERLLRVG